MEDARLQKLINALERADGGSLLVTDNLIGLYNKVMKFNTRNPKFTLNKIELSSDKFKREFCKTLLIAYSEVYECYYPKYECCDEVLARFWAGGIYGYQSQYTTSYWEEVSKYL